MIQQQKEHKSERARRTVAAWVVLVLNLGLGIGVGFLHPHLPFPFVWHQTAMIQWGLFLAFIGYLGAGLTLLLKVRRIAALFQLLCALAWWCFVAHQLVVSRFPDGTYQPATSIACAVLFAIGLVHALLARWLWQRGNPEDGKD